MLRLNAQSPNHFVPEHEEPESVTEREREQSQSQLRDPREIDAPEVSSISTSAALQFSRRKTLQFMFLVLLLMIIFILMLNMSKPEERQDFVRFVPGTELPLIGPYKITRINPNISSLFQLKEVEGYIKKRGQIGNLRRESPYLGAFVEKVLATKKPIFPTVKNSMAIITSCTLDTMCITNLIYMMEFIQPDLPIELWLERGTGPKNLVNYLLKRWYPRLQIRYLDDVEPLYNSYFGAVKRLEKVPPFHYKLMAIICSQYQKLFWVDSDSFLLQNVTKIIKKAKDGTLFWHDIWRIHEKNPVWSLMNMSEPIRGFSQESGILYLDKTITWRSLYVSAYMNQKQRLYYSLFWGDKESFFLSFELLKMPYYFVPHAPFMIGKYGSDIGLGITIPESRFDDFFGYSFVQLDVDGRAFCVHLVSGKSFILRYLRQGKRLFTVLRPYDPNRSHMNRNGLKNKTFDVRLDSVSEKMQLMSTDYALGPFEERFKSAFLEAENVLSGYK